MTATMGFEMGNDIQQNYAHSIENKPQSDWQLLEDHLRNVAELAKSFAGEFGSSGWGYLAGLWHDLGKYSVEFQSYLKSQNEACAESLPGRVDHSSAGAQHAMRSIPIVGHLLSYAIAGHHAGLLDGRSEYACQEKRLLKNLYPWKHGLQELPEFSMPELPPFVCEALARKNAFIVAFFARMLFSCLVDADFLNAESSMNPRKFKQRGIYPTIEELAPRFFQSLAKLEAENAGEPIPT